MPRVTIEPKPFRKLLRELGEAVRGEVIEMQARGVKGSARAEVRRSGLSTFGGERVFRVDAGATADIPIEIPVAASAGLELESAATRSSNADFDVTYIIEAETQ